MIQPNFDLACNARCPNTNKNIEIRLQASQNKCIGFCLKLNYRYLEKGVQIFKKKISFRFMKEYHNVFYAVYKDFVLRIVQTILMRYMFF